MHHTEIIHNILADLREINQDPNIQILDFTLRQWIQMIRDQIDDEDYNFKMVCQEINRKSP